MAHRSNHYDAAVEAYLRGLRVPYVAVDEARRALFAEVSLKSLDFIVYSSRGPNLLVDVKGRRFPSGERSPRLWENWSTADDVESLLRWQEVFGPGFRSVLVFAYNLTEERYARHFREQFAYRDRQYAFMAIALEAYQQHMHVRSARWGTVSLSARRFRELAGPLADLL